MTRGLGDHWGPKSQQAPELARTEPCPCAG